MINQLIGFSIRNKILIILFATALVLWGSYSLSRLAIDAVPDITNNQVQLITQSPTYSAQEIERFITLPLELAVANVQKVEEIRSISRFGISVITIVFEDNVDIYLARQWITERIRNVNIPPQMGTPEMTPVTTGLGEIYQYVLHPKNEYLDKYTPHELRTIQDWVVKRQLAGIPGVVDINSFGGFVKQYEVAINPEKLRAMDLSLTDVFNALQTNNENTGGSYIEKNAQAYFIRAEGMVKTMEDIENVVIRNRGDIPVLVKDIARVRIGNAMRYGAMSQNAKGEVVGGIVMMLKGANSADVIRRVKERIAQIQRSLPEGLVIESFLDRSDLVGRAIHTVEKNLLEGGLIVIFVLVIFLGNLRAGLIVASVIPLALLFAFGMMDIFGVSANLMSLGAVDFGLVVDGAVIIVEAIVHRVYHHYPNRKISQTQLDESVYVAATQIRQSAAFGEIIILIVYLPILSLVGVEGKMFRPMAQTVGFTILGALILSLTYVPAMTALFLHKNIQIKRSFSDRLMSFFYKLYRPAILISLRAKYWVLGLSGAFLLLALLVFSTLGGEFIPQLDEGDFALEVRLPSGSNLTQTLESSQKMEKILLNFPEVRTVVSKIGTSEIPTDPMPLEANDLMVILKNPSPWLSAPDKESLADTMRQALAMVPGVNLEFQQPIEMRFNELLTGIKSDIAVKIYGENLDILYQKANECARYIRKVKGATDIKVEQIIGLPQMLVRYNRQKIAQYGLQIQEINRLVQTAFAGQTAGQVFEEEKRFDLVLRFERDYRRDIENIKELYVVLPNGNQVPLEELAMIDYENAPVQISRDNTQRRITVGLNVSGRDIESVVKDIQTSLNQHVKLPPGYYFRYGGQFENLEKARARLMVAVPLALVLIFVLLYFTFGSIKQSVLIFTAIPMSAIGGVMALWFRGMPFSISAGVGFIALFGVAVLNGIVLIGYFNQLKKEGMINLYRRILVGTKVRLRPVIMTASVASLGFMPMALSQGAGAEVQKPLATVVIGGLITATLLTLLVLPVMYSLFEQKTKVHPPTPKILAVLLFLILFSPVYAQTPKELELDEAITMTLQNSSTVKIASLQVDQNQVLQKSAWDIPKTSVNVGFGNINNYETDYSVLLNQNLEAPGYYKARKEVLRENTVLSEKERQRLKNDLVRKLKLIYMQCWYYYALEDLLTREDSLFQKNLDYVVRQVQLGETGSLDRINVENRLQKNRQLLRSTQRDIQIQHLNLLQTLGTDEDYRIPRHALTRVLNLTQTPSIDNNPYLAALRQEMELAQAKSGLAKKLTAPLYNFGYFNMRESHSINRHVVYFGLAFPIFKKSFKAQNNAAKIQEDIAKTQFDYYEKLYGRQIGILVQTQRKIAETLDYYEQEALVNAQKMLQQADYKYRNGEIGGLEFMYYRLQALDIRKEYLINLLDYQINLLEIEYLAGNEL